MKTDILIVGGGTGGVAAALGAGARGRSVVLTQMLQEFVSSGRLTVLLNRKAAAADVERDRVVSVQLRDLNTGALETIEADYILDTTELGDLLPLAKVEYVIGAESRSETHEPHAIDGPAQPNHVQAFTWCFAMAFDPTPSANHVIAKPAQYERWRSYIPKLTPPYTGRLLDWTYP